MEMLAIALLKLSFVSELSKQKMKGYTMVAKILLNETVDTYILLN